MKKTEQETVPCTDSHKEHIGAKTIDLLLTELARNIYMLSDNLENLKNQVQDLRTEVSDLRDAED